MSSPDNFSINITETIINNDFESFSKFIMNAEDFDYMIEKTSFTKEER